MATTDEGSTNSARTKQANNGMITKRENCFRGETGEAVSSAGPMLDIADAEDAFPVTSVADVVIVEFAAVGVPWGANHSSATAWANIKAREHHHRSPPTTIMMAEYRRFGL